MYHVLSMLSDVVGGWSIAESLYGSVWTDLKYTVAISPYHDRYIQLSNQVLELINTPPVRRYQ